jgi:predicted XRE-type DNA-binding protein
MAKSNELGTREAELLEKLLCLQLYALGATQSQIARFMGKSKTWVNDLMKGMPKKKELILQLLAQGTSQDQIASALGVNQSTVSRLVPAGRRTKKKR